MYNSDMKYTTMVLSILVSIFLAPWLLLNSKVLIQEEYLGLETKNLGLVFGTVVSQEKINPLLKERLEMGILLYETGKIKKIVVSNTPESSLVMQNYLLGKAVPESDIIVDETAVITRDSCNTNLITSETGSVLFISQSFHLPRILYECQKQGVEGLAVPAEYVGVIDRSNTTLYDIVTIRMKRYIREIVILWGDIVLQSFIFE